MDPAGRKMLRFEQPEKRPNWRFMDVAKDDMKVLGVSEEDE